MPWHEGQQLNTCCSEHSLPASKLPLALNRHRNRVNICSAKSCTPVFLFLLSSRPEPPQSSWSHPDFFLHFPFHCMTGIVAQLKEYLCRSVFVSQGHQSHSWVFTVGQIKVLVLRLTLKDVGFTLDWWLWLSRLGLQEEMPATCRIYTTPIYIMICDTQN